MKNEKKMILRGKVSGLMKSTIIVGAATILYILSILGRILSGEVVEFPSAILVVIFAVVTGVFYFRYRTAKELLEEK